MRGAMMGSGARWIALCAVFTGGCFAPGGDGGNGGGEADAIVIGQPMPDMAPMPEADPLRDYCDARAEAICGWAYGCFGATGTLAAFELTGPELEDCVADQAERCHADLSDREARGTLSFSAEGGARCATALRDAPCLETPPASWVGQWQDYVQNQCGGVARGLVATGDACAVQADCATPADACVDGACAPIPAGVLVQACDGGDDLGLPAPDPDCPTGTCVLVEGGGICSASCAGGRGCGESGVCLAAQTVAGAIRPYCALACAAEGDPTCLELSCDLINADGDERVCSP